MHKNNEDKKIVYLQMLQNTITRMSTASAIFKGFSATIVSGIALISFEETNSLILGLSFFPILVFWALDLYYLRLERIHRYWYEQVRIGTKPVDFKLDINPKKEKIDYREARIRIFADCIWSKSIMLFYPIMSLILLIILIINARGGFSNGS